MKKKFIEPELTFEFVLKDVLLESNYGQDNIEGWKWGDSLGGGAI